MAEPSPTGRRHPATIAAAENRTKATSARRSGRATPPSATATARPSGTMTAQAMASARTAIPSPRASTNTQAAIAPAMATSRRARASVVARDLATGGLLLRDLLLALDALLLRGARRLRRLSRLRLDEGLQDHLPELRARVVEVLELV